MLIHQAVELILQEENITKAELAKELGISPGMVSHYSSHGNHYPRLNVARKIYEQFKIQVEPYTLWSLENKD